MMEYQQITITLMNTNVVPRFETFQESARELQDETKGGAQFRSKEREKQAALQKLQIEQCRQFKELWMKAQVKIEELEKEILASEESLHLERKSHIATNQRLSDALVHIEQIKLQHLDELRRQEQSERITHTFQEVALENTQLKTQLRVNNQLNEKLKLALQQANLNLEQFSRKSAGVAEATQTELGEPFDQKTHLMERINNQNNGIKKFVEQYVDKKKVRNKSANEVKFYIDLQSALETLQNENSSISSQFQKFLQLHENKSDTLQKTLATLEEVKMRSDSQNQTLSHLLKLQEVEHDQQLLQLKSQLIQADERLTSIKADLKSSEAENSQLHQEMQQLSELNQSLQQSHARLTSELTSERDHLRIQNQQLQQQFFKMQSQYHEANLQITTLAQKLEMVDSEKFALKEQIASQNALVQHSSEQLRELEAKLLQLHVDREKATLQADHLSRAADLIQDQYELSQKNLREIYEKYAEIQRSLGKLEEENTQLKVYSHKLQVDLQERNVLVTSLKSQVEQLEFQLYQSPQQQEASYLSNKLDDLGALLREKDLQLQELEKSYHLATYDLRALREYHESLKKESEEHRQTIQRLSLELEGSYANQREMSEEKMRKVGVKIGRKAQDFEPRAAGAVMLKGEQSDRRGPMQVKILSGEIQRLSQTIQFQKRKIKDLEFFIEQMVTANPENQHLAKQILISAGQKGEIVTQSVNQNDFDSGETFGMVVDPLEEDP